MKKRRIISLFIILPVFALISFSAYAQSSSAGLYSDELFNEYIELEDSLIAEPEGKIFTEEELERIQTFRQKAEEARREDLLSRADMLYFVVATEINRMQKQTEAENILAEILKTEKKKNRLLSAEKTTKTIAGISLGTAIVSGSVFAASALISSNYYTKYTQTEYADQAAFYLFWWQLLEDTAIISAITAAVSSLAAGILAAVM